MKKLKSQENSLENFKQLGKINLIDKGKLIQNRGGDCYMNAVHVDTNNRDRD